MNIDTDDKSQVITNLPRLILDIAAALATMDERSLQQLKTHLHKRSKKMFDSTPRSKPPLSGDERQALFAATVVDGFYEIVKDLRGL